MSFALGILGSLLTAAVLADALKTTLSAQGDGPLSRAAATLVWNALGRGPGGSLPRRAAGGSALVTIVLVWTGGLWLGWLLIFAATPDAVTDAQTGEPAPLAARAYFVGYTLFTLGNGDFVPAAGAWQVLTAVASFSGLFLTTLAITYLIPVVQAVAAKRRLAAQLHGLGDSGSTIARLAPGGLARQLESVAHDLGLHAERHLVYPVVHYFQSPTRRTALAPALATLADALVLLRAGSPDPLPLDRTSLRAASASLDGFLDTLRQTGLANPDDAPAPPPAPHLDGLDPDRLHRQTEAACPARQLLLHAAREDGWAWPTE